MLDRERVLAYANELAAALEDWERYRDRVTLDQLRQDRDVRNMVLHAMLVAIQAAIDIGQHILVANRWERPGTYRETFDLLAVHGMVGGELGEGLARLAGLRNALVHVYWKLDLDAVHRVFQAGPETLRAFTDIVKRLLTEEGSQ